MKLSIVLPIYNEEDNILELTRRVNASAKKVTKSFEIIIVNDGSSDKSLIKIKSLRRKNKKVKIISFSRNFGHMSAVNAGLNFASGGKVVVMDADLQDPPELIMKMWQKGKKYDVVFAIKEKRKESIIKRLSFEMFYWLLDKISPLNMPKNAGTYSLLDKNIVEILNNLPEKNKFFSGLRVWAGFSQTRVVYERGERSASESKSFTNLVGFGLDGLFSFSYLPLRISSILGFIFAGVAFVFILVVFFLRVFFDFGIIGWVSTMTAILLIGGIQLITLGIIGEYLARIYDEVKGRPDYIVSETVGFSNR